MSELNEIIEEKGNAFRINQVCLPIIPLTMLRYQAFADFYLEEPRNVYITLQENTERRVFEQIFRYRCWIPNKSNYSWLIYSATRDVTCKKNEGLMLRYIKWNKVEDIDKIKKASKEDKSCLLSGAPSITAINCYLPLDSCYGIIEIIKKIDLILYGEYSSERGNLTGSKNDSNTIELFRLFDSGKIEKTWAGNTRNRLIENQIECSERIFKDCIELDNKKVFKIDLDYTIPPNLYRKIITGGS